MSLAPFIKTNSKFIIDLNAKCKTKKLLEDCIRENLDGLGYNNDSIRYNTRDTIQHLFKLIECATPRMNPKVIYKLWVTVMCQNRFINYNKCTSLVWNVDNREPYACVMAGDTWEICILSSTFYCETRTTLKKIKPFKMHTNYYFDTLRTYFWEVLFCCVCISIITPILTSWWL